VNEKMEIRKMAAIELKDEKAQNIAREMLTEVVKNQAYYAYQFIKTATFLDSKSFYEKVAEFVNLKSGEQVILDIGCGDCRAIREIRKIKPVVTIVGVDINPMLLMTGENMLKGLDYTVNMHTGVNVAMDPSNQKLTLISDVMYNSDTPFRFKREVINLIQEDIRYAEVTVTLGKVDIILYTLTGGFSPHVDLEREAKADSSIKAGIEMNNVVMGLGIKMLMSGGRMIWAQRIAAKNTKTISTIDLDALNLGIFKPYYDVIRTEVLEIDENKAGLGLTLPAFAASKPGDTKIHYNEDVRKMEGYDFHGAIVLIEMVKK
jgi:SAM-dependent methyltransferase